MHALLIVFAVLLIIALLRFGVAVRYGADGVVIKAHIGPVSLNLFPRKEKTRRERKKREPRAKRKKEIKRKPRKTMKPVEEKPGKLDTFMRLLAIVGKTLRRLRRRLLIKRLKLHFTAASDDPFKTAMEYGGAVAAAQTIIPALKQNFRIRRLSIANSFDFESEKPRIYLDAALSLAVWESVYLFFAIFPAIGIIKQLTVKSDRKDEQDNGETPD